MHVWSLKGAILSQPEVELNEPRTKELMARWTQKEQLEKWKKTVLSQKIKIHKVFQKEGSVSSVNAIRKVKQDEDWSCEKSQKPSEVQIYWE